MDVVVGPASGGTLLVVSRCVIIPHLQVFLVPPSLSSLVARGNQFVQMYEERRDIDQTN